MGALNASPLVVRILFWIVGVLYLIAGAFLAIFHPLGATPAYAGGWLMVLIAIASIWVGGVLTELLARRSLFPDILLATMVAVRLFTDRASLFGSEMRTGAVVGLGIALVVVVYLWSQVRRLRGAVKVG